VLVDIERHLARSGKSLDYEAGEAFGVRLLDEAAEAQGVEFRAGDILLIRTGWAGWFLETLTQEEQIARRARSAPTPGLIQARETCAWLWDHQFTMVAADNSAVEASPAADPEPFYTETDKGLMHQELIAMLGLVLGELFRLDELAADCAQDLTYDCLVVCKPLALTGGVGSTANALAIR
jgi:kynurenine formamidase